MNLVFFRTVVPVFLFLFLVNTVIAQIPKLISYQGFLTENNEAIADGDYSIVVKIFDAETDGNELWSETISVSTINGLFSTALGASTALDLPFDQAYFLSTTFDGTELLPRTAMTASPYAFNSVQAGNPFALDNADGSATEVVYVDDNSNLGVGTNTPSTNLHVKSLPGVKNELFIEPGNWNLDGDEAQISLGDFNHRITAIFGQGMNFYDVDQFRFINAGTTFEQRVGIGADPDPGALLYVNGNIKVLDDNSIFGLDGLWGFNDLRFFGDQNGIENGPDMVITPEGNVGIGKVSLLDPAAKLTVGNQDIALNFYPGRRGFSDDVNAFHLDMDGTKDLTITDNVVVANKMVVGSLQSPGDDELFVDGSIRVTDDNNLFGLDAIVGFNDLRFFGDPNGDVEDLFIGPDGNVMVGDAGQTLNGLAKFQVNGADGKATLIQDSELKLLGPNTAHFSIYNDQNFAFRIDNTSSLAQPGTPGTNLMSITSTGNTTFAGVVTAPSFFQPSDQRYKREFESIDQALEKVRQMNGWYYHWKTKEFPTKQFTNQQQIGLIAQEVETIFPEMVATDAEGYKSVNYSLLTPVLVEAIKEQQTQIDQLKAEKAALSADLETLKAEVLARLAALESSASNSEAPAQLKTAKQ